MTGLPLQWVVPKPPERTNGGRRETLTRALRVFIYSFPESEADDSDLVLVSTYQM